MASFDMALVDEVRKRLDATYGEALAGLEESEGDLLRALAAIERRRKEQQAAADSGELIGRAIGLAKQGKLKGLRLKLGDRTLRELPLPKGPGGAVLGALLSGIFSQLDFELIKKEPAEADIETSPEPGQRESG
jgi:hypothetical protein